jgi:hypothetical protein
MTEFSFVKEITPAGVGIYTLIAIVLVALIKAWPVISLQATTAREKLRAEGRSDLSDCKQRIDALQRELNGVKDEVHKIEMKLLGAISAYRILDVEIEATNPGSPALAQARQVMSAAFTLSPSTDPPFAMPEGL